MKKSLILHGHFYQPPRENPDTGIIPIQKTAYPKENWNIRIADECYSANAFSRFLTYDGRIRSISNNYEYISYNFGPTLFHWLMENRYDVYSKIISADKTSRSRNNGHGNAIAQSFNHTILPLDSAEDAEIQIDWGLEDFLYHYSREAEGMWLPETAVNDRVLDILIDRGVKFLILSPWQAESVEDEKKGWIHLKQNPAPYNKAYSIDRPGGSIAAFFYHAGLAEGISFGHFLQNADTLYEKLKGIYSSDDSQLLHTATDGEIYGHHEPFGDMCLAALIQRISHDKEIEFTNYAAYLEQHPAELKAVLKKGEANKGTSWSCFHGVSRWYKDCGCSTGGKDGWNQKWRTPLRNGFNAISDELLNAYKKNLKKYTEKEAFSILKKYGEVLSGRKDYKTFCDDILGKSCSENDRKGLLTLLEGQKYRLFMFTSCGWFFSDISGIEPKQNIKYALQILDLYSDLMEEDLFEKLKTFLIKSKSNIASEKNGAVILQGIKDNTLPCGLEPAVYFSLNRKLTSSDEWESSYGMFSLTEIRKNSLGGDIVSVRKEPTGQVFQYTIISEFDLEKGMLLHCRMNIPHDSSYNALTMDNIEAFAVSKFFKWIDKSLERVTDNDMDQIFLDMKYYTGISRQASYQPDKHFYIANMGTCMRTLNSLFKHGIPYYDRTKFHLIKDLLEFIFQKGGHGERETTNAIISSYIKQIDESMTTEHSTDIFSFTKDLLVLIRESGFVPDITQLQNKIFELLQYYKQFNEQSSAKKKTTNEEFSVLKSLAVQAGIIVEDY